MSGCPEFHGKANEFVSGNIDVSIINSGNPLMWNYLKISCLVESSKLNLTLDRGTLNDLSFLEREVHFNTETGEISSIIPNNSTIVKLTMGCFYGVFRWQCLVPHVISSVKRENMDQIVPVNNEYPEITQLVP